MKTSKLMRDQIMKNLKIAALAQKKMEIKFLSPILFPQYSTIEELEARLDRYTWSMRSGILAGLRDADESYQDPQFGNLRMEVRRYLLEAHGIDFDALVGSHEKVAKRILKRGSIKSDDEARSLESFIISLCGTEEDASANQDLIDLANGIMNSYENSIMNSDEKKIII